MDRDIAAGKAREMVLVISDANTRYGGSMYSSSPTTGDWETFVTEELVAYIDGHYRTLADRESRGLGGHSMGGYGVWRIAMKRPDVYSSIYAMSACCLMNNPQPRPPRAAQRRPQSGAPELEPGAHPVNVPYGEAAAWSPNPENPPLYFDEPVQDGSVRFEIAAKWIANSPLAMLDQYLTNMAKYDAIGMEVGLKDTLLGSNQEMDRALTRQGVEHTFQTFDGAHSDRLAERIEQAVLPFFSEHLKFDASKDAGR
jgi:S-formylglutathione hydrolase FrmB